MGKLVVLKLDGNFKQGFRATLEIGSEGERPEVEIMGNLPPATELAEQYDEWQSTYRSLGRATRVIKPKGARLDGSLKKGKEECRTQAWELRDRLNTWLRAESFSCVRETWLEKVSTSDRVRVLIRADHQQLWQLPWHQWDLLERYRQAEVGLGPLESRRPPRLEQHSLHKPVKILAILGSSEDIQVEEDRKQLESLPGAVTTFLVEPQRQELNDQLWEQSWDLLFFAGHSQTEGKRGRIYLNQDDSLTLEELKYTLKKAVESGLQLAIFNSCDGLGLARELKSLHIPQLIVMREPVPDQVAQAFLQYFLQSFASGKPLYVAVQEARQRLERLEGDFPCASWLPVICQNPAAVPPSWPEQVAPSEKILPESSMLGRLTRWNRFRTVLLTSLVVTSLVMGGRWLGLLQRWELESYDLLLRQRPSELPDDRILLVGADEEDISKYGFPLPDAVLAQLIEKLNQSKPVAIGLDTIRNQSVPLDDRLGHQSLVAQLQHNRHVITACGLGNSKKKSTAPPPNSPAAQVGFIDLENDPPDATIRRHLQSRSSNQISSLLLCETPYSFSLQLADRYLEAKNIPVKTTSQKNWQFGNVVFKRLEPHSGGYQNLDSRGNQVLINYRASSPITRSLTIQEVLNGQFKPEWVENAIVILGVTAESGKDFHSTPYGNMPGLEVHAHMVSQILSAVQDRRPLIWWLPGWGDTVWVWIWSLTSGIIVYQLRSQNWRDAQLLLCLVLSISICVVLLYGMCSAILVQGGWLPLVPTMLAIVFTATAIGYPRFPT